MRLACAILSLALIIGCSDPVEPQGAVSAVVEGSAVIVTNESTAPIFFLVLPQVGRASIDYYICADPIRCNPIPPGQSRSSSLAAGMFQGETEVIVIVWRSHRNANREWEPEFLPGFLLRIN